MSRSAMGLLLLALGAAGCGDDPPPSGEGVGQALPTPPPRPWGNDSIYGADGELRESDEVVAGLTLPMGLDEVEELSRERRHVYRSDVPQQKLISYFGPRLNTVQIDREAHSVTYRDAVPQGVRGGVVRLDVTIEPGSARPSLVEIFERPPPPPEGTVVSEDAIRRHLDTLRPERRE